MARDFDGSTDRIDYANILNWSEQAQTISMWVYPDVLDGARALIYDHAAENTDSGGVNMRVINPGAIIFYQVYGAAWTNRQSNDYVLSINSWQHVLATWTGNGGSNIHIYVDGSEVAYRSDSDGSGGIVAGTGSHSIGGRIYDDSKGFNGRFGAVGRWNRVLSAGEIGALAAGYSPLFFMNELKFAPDLIRGANDLISGKVGSLDGTTVIAHPRIIRPAG